MEKIDLTNNSHFEVLLENEEARFYASLHFDHTPGFDGPVPNVEQVHCYMLEPNQGSLNFVLQYDPSNYLYFPTRDFPKIDSLVLDELNLAIKNHLENLR
ncbi:MAG: hypothetical protein J7502_04695 [Flavisolibacter sp.]|nr:hypothetical protein [Flavisolibacter sp.]